jgi:hypothetical protein
MRVFRVLLLVSQSGDKMLSKEGVETGEKVLDRLVWRRCLDDRFFFFSHKL